MTDKIFYTEGAKNSFFLTFSKDLSLEDLQKKALDLSLDPDGYIIAQKKSENEAEFVFYNKDSSLVDFCGNALRATGLCFFDQFGQKNLKLSTAVGEMCVEVVSKDTIKAQMPHPKRLGDVKIDEMTAQYIVSGVPHLVFDLNKVGLNFNDEAEIKVFCHKVRAMNLGEDKQTFNLTFYEIEENRVNCVTFERGVEDFTQACGSGALSAFSALQGVHSNIKMPGGMLKIYKKGGDHYMEGPATIIKRIEL